MIELSNLFLVLKYILRKYYEVIRALEGIIFFVHFTGNNYRIGGVG